MGAKFLACCVLQDKKRYCNCLYWCKYVRDSHGAMQRLKATVPDRRVWPMTVKPRVWLPLVWLSTPACVIVAVPLSKALKDAHSRRLSNLHVRAARFCGRFHLGKWNTHSKYKCQCTNSHDFGPDYTLTLAQIARITTKWIFTEYTVLEIFSPFRIFEQLFACPEKQSLPWNFSLYWIYFLRSGLLSNLRLPWKTEFALNFLKPEGCPPAPYAYDGDQQTQNIFFRDSYTLWLCWMHWFVSHLIYLSLAKNITQQYFHPSANFCFTGRLVAKGGIPGQCSPILLCPEKFVLNI